ncbi:hypothetical protein [Corynebacterium sp.]|uniref:hypothetical protein n=1 Tax=Corynebacterium sp. TaxID=1720 RepID=UPI0026E03132|nr:hypothetical protein [Corynebacterium sp.]MDO5511666.1 hypothetical protein [Corynebacterium sp.]
MLSPVPGLTHLKVLTPRPLLIDATPPPPPPETGSQRRVEALTRIALEACFGIRPVLHLAPDRFAGPVRLHVAARQRQGLRGTVRIDTLHLRSGGEVFGTAVSGGRAYAFTGRAQEGRLLSFRVL